MLFKIYFSSKQQLAWWVCSQPSQYFGTGTSLTIHIYKILRSWSTVSPNLFKLAELWCGNDCRNHSSMQYCTGQNQATLQDVNVQSQKNKATQQKRTQAQWIAQNIGFEALHLSLILWRDIIILHMTKSMCILKDWETKYNTETKTGSGNWGF